MRRLPILLTLVAVVGFSVGCGGPDATPGANTNSAANANSPPASGWAARAWTWHEAADTSLFYPRQAEDREGDLVWVDVDRILELPLWEGDRFFLPLVFDPAAPPFHGVMPYSGGKPQAWRYSSLGGWIFPAL